MSAILLSGSSKILNEVKAKDPNAFIIDGTTAIVAEHDAIFCRDLLKVIYSHAAFDAPHINASNNKYCKRSEYMIEGGFTLQIVHDTNIMGPLKFLNVGYGNYSCPWGIWSIFRTYERKTLNLEEARTLYNLAKTFTYNYSSYNKMHAQRLSYFGGSSVGS